MYNLVTVGSAHQGVSKIPGCSLENAWCTMVDYLVSRGVYSKLVQTALVPAQYFKVDRETHEDFGDSTLGTAVRSSCHLFEFQDPFQIEVYKKSCHFLSDINNENQVTKDAAGPASFFGQTGSFGTRRIHSRLFARCHLLFLTDQLDL
jgi:hypothetical protein